MDNIIIFIIGIIVFILACLGISIKKDKKTEKEIKDELKKKPASDIINDLDNSDVVKSTINSGGDRFSDKVRSLLHGFGRKGIDPSDIPGSNEGNKNNEPGGSQGSGDPLDSKDGNSGMENTKPGDGQGFNDNNNSSGGDGNNSNNDIGNNILKKVSMFDKQLLPEIRRTGCVYLVCAGIVTDIIQLSFDTDSLNKLYLEAIDNGCISRNYITSYANMINFLLNNMGSKKEAVHIGNNIKLFNNLPMDKKYTDATILCFTTPFSDVGNEHFKQGNNEGKLIYDPAFGKYDEYCKPNGFLRLHIS